MIGAYFFAAILMGALFFVTFLKDYPFINIVMVLISNLIVDFFTIGITIYLQYSSSQIHKI